MEHPTAPLAELGANARSAAELAAIFESDAIGMAIVVAGTFTRCNRKYERLYGYEPGTLVGQKASSVFRTVEEYEERVAEAKKVLMTGSIFREVREAHRRDGTPLWLSVCGAALDAERIGHGTVWMVEDITQARKQEERARRNVEIQQLIFDNAAVGIMFARRRNIVRYNLRLGDMLGYGPDELIGQSTRILYATDAEYKDAGIAGLGPILAGEGYVQEVLFSKKDGSQIWMRGTGRQVPLATPGEDIIWIFEDVSARRQAEEALRAAHTELQERLVELQSTQSDLIHADRLASLGALVAGIAHELNTPLGNALVSATTLRDRFLEMQASATEGTLRRSSLDAFLSDGAEIADLVFRSANRAAELVTSFKQVAVDQTSEQRRGFDLRAVVDDIVATLRPSLKHTPWIIEVDIPENTQCDGFPGPLGQIVANMVNNAALHAFAGRDQGTLRIIGRVQAPDDVVLEFKDNGKGIEPAHLGQLFTPFFTTRKGQGGSGLGLSISRNIAKNMMGGSLSVTSTPGQGSSFVLCFPRSVPTMQADRDSQP